MDVDGAQPMASRLAALEDSDPHVWREEAEALIRWRDAGGEKPFVIMIYETLKEQAPEVGDVPYEELDEWARAAVQGGAPVPEWNVR